jgi:hypothetical protein
MHQHGVDLVFNGIPPKIRTTTPIRLKQVETGTDIDLEFRITLQSFGPYLTGVAHERGKNYVFGIGGLQFDDAMKRGSIIVAGRTVTILTDGSRKNRSVSVSISPLSSPKVISDDAQASTFEKSAIAQ